MAYLIRGVPLKADHAVTVSQTAKDARTDAVFIELALRVLQSLDAPLPFARVCMSGLAATDCQCVIDGLAETACLALWTEGAQLAHPFVPGDAHPVCNVDGRIGLADALVIAAV